MAKASKQSVTETFCEVTPVDRRRLDPYKSVYVAVGESYILDSKKARMLSDMGEVEIINEDVMPPWETPEAPAAPATASIAAPKPEIKK